VRIEDGTVVAPNTVIPPFSKVSGRPGVVIEELPETAQDSLERMLLTLIDRTELEILTRFVGS
jgi:hypothetical protein